MTDQNDAPNTPTVGVVVSTPQDTTAEPQPTYMVPENHAVKVVAAVDDPQTDAIPAVVLATFAVANGTDPDGGESADVGDPASTLELTLGGTDGSLFSLTDTDAAGGVAENNTYELVFKESPNYESPADADGNSMYHVTVITADNEGATHELPLVITVLNVDEEGEVTLSTSQPAIGQELTATLTDPDMGVIEVDVAVEALQSANVTSSFLNIQGRHV